MPLGPSGKIAKALIGSAAVSLATTYITASLTTYGIINVPAARILLALAGIVLIAGITTSDYLREKSWKHVCIVGVLSTVVIGSTLFWLDGWALRIKAELDARSTPPPLSKGITTPPTPPAFGFLKYPKQPPKLPSNIVTGGQNAIGNKSTGNNNVLGGQVCPNGICIGGDNNGTATVNNFGPPSRRIRAADRAKVLAILKAKPGKITINYIMGDEPYQFATDMYETLQSAGWNIVGMRAVMLDKPWKGAMVRFHVKEKLNLPDGAPVDVPDNSLAGTLITALMQANIGNVTVQPTPDEPEDSISLVIGPYPKD